MNLKKINLYNFLITLGLVLLLTSIQTTLWYQWFGRTPPPPFWLIVSIYLLIFRQPFVSLFMIYILGLAVSVFSAIPLGMLLPTLLIMAVIVQYVKSRFFWPGLRYFLISIFLSTLLFNGILILLSLVLQKNPTPIYFFRRLIEVLLATITAVPMYHFLKWLDLKMDPDMALAQGERE